MLKQFLFYLKRKISRTHLEVIIIFLLSLTPLFWFKGGEVVLGHDSGFRLLSIPYLKSLFYSWNPNIGFGVDWAINKGFLVTQIPEVLANYLTGSLSLAQRLTFVLWFFVMGISMYIFVRNFFSERKYWIFRIFASLFYIYNFFILQAWSIGERAKFSLYAALPLAILIIYRTVRGKYSLLKGSILFALLFFFLNGGGSPPLFGSIFLFCFLAFLVFTFIEVYKKGFRAIFRPVFASIFFTLAFLVVNAFWIFSQAYLFFNIYGPELASVGGITGALVWEGIVNRFSSFINLFRFQGIPDWYSGAHLYSAPFIKNPALIIASFIPIVVILVGLWFYLADKRKEGRKNEIVFFVLLLFLIGLIFTAGSHPPLGFIYVFLIKYLPGFAIFRTAFYKFAPTTWFSAAFLTGFFLNFLILKFIIPWRKRLLAGVLSIIFILSYHYPFFSNRFFDWNEPFTTRVKIPSYVEEMSDYINGLSNDGLRILMVPPMDPQFNSDNYSWGYWSLDLLPRLSTTNSLIANDTEREELVDAMYSAIESGDEADFRFFANLAGVNKILWRDDVLYNNKISGSKDASFWEENLKSFQGVSLEKTAGSWRLYGLDSFLYKTAVFTTPESFSYVQLEKSRIEDTFSALGKKSDSSLVYSNSTVRKDVAKILTYSGAKAVEASCVYCKPGEYMQFIDDLSLPYVNFLPGSLFYGFVEKREEKVLEQFGDFPSQRIDANLGLSNKRLGEISQLIGRAGSLDKKGRDWISELISQNILRYRQNIEDVMPQLDKLSLMDRNSYSLKILGHLYMHKRSLSAIENEYNLAAEVFDDLYGLINEKISQLEKEVWVTEEETSKRYLVGINEPGVYRLEIAGHIQKPISIFLNGKVVDNTREITLDVGVYRLELIYPEPQNLLEESTEGIIDISKNESRKLRIKDYSYSDSYAVSFEYKASENTHPSLLIYQDNDKINIEGKRDHVKKDLKTSEEIRTFGFTFDPNFLAREGYLGFEYQGFNKFRKEEYFEVFNPRVYRTFTAKAFFVKEQAAKQLVAPRIEAEAISPTEYQIKITGAKSEFVLNFGQSYNNGWKAYFVDDDIKPSIFSKLFPGKFFKLVDESFHFSLNGYSNAWLIDKTGDYEIKIIYVPQNLFYVGLLVTSIALLTFVILLIFLRKRKYVAEN